MQYNITTFAGLGLSMTAVCMIYYMFVAKIAFLGPYRIANMVFSSVGFLFFFYIILKRLCYGLKHPHYQVSKLIAEKMNLKGIKVGIAISLIVLLFAYVSIYYVYNRDQNRPKPDLWAMETNINVCFTIFMYLCSFLKARRPVDPALEEGASSASPVEGSTFFSNKEVVFCWTFYFAVLVLLIMFFAHIPIFSYKPENPVLANQVYFMLLIIMYNLQVFWEKTPIIVRMLIWINELLVLQGTAVNFKNGQYDNNLFQAFQIIKIIGAGLHALWACGLTVNVMISKIRNYRTDEKVDLPLDKLAISQIPRVRFHCKKSSQPVRMNEISLQELQGGVNGNPDNEDQRSRNSSGSECCICMKQIQEGGDVFDLKCRHWFHQECMEEWLLRKNACPSCRQKVVEYY